MAITASNIVLAPPPPEPVQRVTVGGENWREQLLKLNPQPIVHVKKERPVEKLIQYKQSSFMDDMLSINKE